MKRILTAVVLIPVVLFLVFLGPKWHWVFTLAVVAVAALAAWEFLSLSEEGGAKPARIAVTAALGVLFGVSFEWPDHTLAVFCLLSLALLVYCSFTRPIEQIMIDVTSSVFCLVYIGLTLLSLPLLHDESNGPSVVTFLLCAVWAGDSVALYVGRAWGKRKLAPRLSPNKTWAGAVGSMVGSLLAAGLLIVLATQLQKRDIAVLSYPDETWYWLVLAAVVNIAAQVGDLAESALKRSVGVKDSGAILPGHGGVLDRIDALLFAAPALWYAQVIHQIL